MQANSTEVLSEFTKALIEVCEGQALDKIFETQKVVSINDYLLK
jgi:geranylgeranyl pyrophosphate synthase